MSTRERRILPMKSASATTATDCPLAPPAHATVQCRALHRACLILGGIEMLAQRLDTTVPDLRRWMSGEEPAPIKVFENCVEILLLYASKGPAN